MPKPLDTVEKLNYVWKLNMNPCNAPLVVYWETAKPALTQAILTYLMFDFGDVARFFARPIGLRRGGHVRSGLLRRGLLKVPGMKDFAKRPLSPTAKNLWRFDNFTQNIGWWMLITDIAGDFLYNWTTNLYAMNRCPTGAGAVGHPPGFVQTLGGWQGGGFSQFFYERGNININQAGAGSSDDSMFTSVSWSGTNPDPVKPATVGLRVQGFIGARQVTDEQETTVPPLGSFSQTVSIHSSGPATSAWSRKVAGATVEVSSGTAYATTLNSPVHIDNDKFLQEFKDRFWSL